jgi:PAS domain S-box-containing protein/diguanylate cyclase (GGDEF)-like protein
MQTTSDLDQTKNRPTTPLREIGKIEGREWWLWGFAVTVTVVLTVGIVALTLPESPLLDQDWFDLKEWVRGLAALVLMFDIYTVYQHWQLHRVRRHLAERDQLFRLISENAADMIALIDREGRRLYNSPAYQKVLGYSAEELSSTSSMDQVHPDDRERVIGAASKVNSTGQGQRIEYRMRHKDGSWRTLESTASPIRDANGKIDGTVIVNRDITERKRAQELLAHTTLHDGLTNLPNRTLFLDRLQHVITISKRQTRYKFAVLFIDIDDFKVFNESLGSNFGDELLIQIAHRLTASVRSLDTISRNADGSAFRDADSTLARLAGDEFTILLDEIRDSADSVRVAERVQQKLTAPFHIGGHEIFISASIGIAVSVAPDMSAEDMLRDAEIAMHRAKRAGKARCQLFDTAMHASAVERLRLETDLRKAFDRQEFLVYYQPILSLPDARIVGFEALTRWNRGGEIVLPGEFISVADEIGLILSMNRSLLREGCQQLKEWNSQFPASAPLKFGMNISPKHFVQPELAAEIDLIVKESGLPASCLQIEIMETAAMGDPDHAATVLSDLRGIGVGLSIDDFGTGYSSLSRLQQLPIDTLKIDRSFIMRMEEDSESHEIVRTIVTLAHNLGLKVVAEGVETATQVEQLKQMDCDFVQGYFFSKPVSAKAITALLETHQSRLQSLTSN